MGQGHPAGFLPLQSGDSIRSLPGSSTALSATPQKPPQKPGTPASSVPHRLCLQTGLKSPFPTDQTQAVLQKDLQREINNKPCQGSKPANNLNQEPKRPPRLRAHPSSPSSQRGSPSQALLQRSLRSCWDVILLPGRQPSLTHTQTNEAHSWPGFAGPLLLPSQVLPLPNPLLCSSFRILSANTWLPPTNAENVSLSSEHPPVKLVKEESLPPPPASPQGYCSTQKPRR